MATRATFPESAAPLFHLQPELPLCQSDLPLDWYQDEFKPYAAEYLALPDRRPETVFRWLDAYVRPAQAHFGDALLLLAHFYMGGEIVKVIERYGGAVSDSYQLALQARNRPEKKVIVESAVHFMAEAIAILAHPDQDVWITNPKAGCTMELLAKDFLVLPVADQLVERYGDRLTTVAYMNTSGRLKALAGRTGGAVCTSSNAHEVVAWCRAQGRKVFFVPDEHLGRNTALKMGIPEGQIAVWNQRLDFGGIKDDQTLVDARVILWKGWCSTHQRFTPEQIAEARAAYPGMRVVVHPECRHEVVEAADLAGSTEYIVKVIEESPAGTVWAVGTEVNLVKRLAKEHPDKTIFCLDPVVCPCSTMYRIHPAYLAWTLESLVEGKVINQVTVDAETARWAKVALERMLANRA